MFLKYYSNVCVLLSLHQSYSVLISMRERELLFCGIPKLVLQCRLQVLFSACALIYLLDQNFLFVSRDEQSQLKAIDFGLSDFFKPGLLSLSYIIWLYEFLPPKPEEFGYKI